ncbi:MAG: acyloxyacyl hydrolase [Bernardetiaceae bacterium]|nr:acyloxyacyl hydrolase [Bernardetiaceae bacterium]
MIYKLSFFILFFAGITYNLWAQFDVGDSSSVAKNPWIIGLRGHYGYTITHSERLASITQGNPYSVELHLSRHLNSRSVWEACQCYPRLGLMLKYSNFDYPRVLGSAWSAVGFIEPYFSHKNRLMPSLRAGGGVSYLTRIHDPIKNPDNLLFSLPLSFYIFISAGVTYNLSEKINLNLHAGFPHISNGSLRQPNAGINYPSLSLGIEYKPQVVVFPKRTRERLAPTDLRTWRLTALLFGTYKETRQDSEAAVYGAMFMIGKYINRLQELDIGIEYVEDRAMLADLQAPDAEATGRHRALGISLGHYFRMGRFAFGQRLGVYAVRPALAMDRVYHRWSLDYRWDNDWLVGISLKAHRNFADFIQIHLGRRFELPHKQ